MENVIHAAQVASLEVSSARIRKSIYCTSLKAHPRPQVEAVLYLFF